MRFTVITPSYGQLDWLKLCVASVRDQVWRAKAEAGDLKPETGEGRPETGNLNRNEVEIAVGKPEGMREKISIEHIVQDAGTPGIEDFVREEGASFHRDGKEVFSSQSSVGSDSKAGYSLTPCWSEIFGGPRTA